MFIMKQTDDNNINPSNAFCVITLLIILMIALMGLMSCSTHRVVEQVKEMHTDTVYVTSLQYDSIYIYNDKMLDRIKALGTDIIWFLPIHPIGVKGKKGKVTVKLG